MTARKCPVENCFSDLPHLHPPGTTRVEYREPTREETARTIGLLVEGRDLVNGYRDAAVRLTKLATFGALVAERVFDPDLGFGDLDGADAQDFAIEAGILVEWKGEPHPECEACADGGPCYVFPDDVRPFIDAVRKPTP